ncbi:MAG: hypothetical protein JNM40_00830 [Myxococcales bacterium]|nr:hypothetical protein [Myxococcales bacterium]
MSTIDEAIDEVRGCASRMGQSILRSWTYLDDATWQRAKEILTMENLWTLCLVFAGWLIATIVGGPVGIAINAILTVWGVIALWDIAGELFELGKEWALACYRARSEEDLDAAGQVFAKLLATGVLDLLQVLVLHRVFRSVRARLRDKIPVPSELAEAEQKARTQRERGKVSKTAEAALETAVDRAAAVIPADQSSSFPFLVTALFGVAGIGGGLYLLSRRSK